MTPKTSTQLSLSDFREALLREVGERERVLHENRAAENTMVVSKNHEARRHADRMDFDAARIAMAESGRAQKRVVEISHDLNALDEERQAIVRGTDPRIVSHSIAGHQANRHAAQAEHAQAMAEFHQQISANEVLLKCAQRCIDACAAMQFEPPRVAVEIVNSAQA